MPGPLRGPARSRQNSLLEQAYSESATYMPRPHPAQPIRNMMMGDAEHQAGLQGYENQFSSELDLSASNATNLDSWWNDTFGQLPAATGVSGDTGFNPFYLSQLGQGSDTMSENRSVLSSPVYGQHLTFKLGSGHRSETDFLNILLSTIANNSTLGTGA